MLGICCLKKAFQPKSRVTKHTLYPSKSKGFLLLKTAFANKTCLCLISHCMNKKIYSYSPSTKLGFVDFESSLIEGRDRFAGGPNELFENLREVIPPFIDGFLSPTAFPTDIGFSALILRDLLPPCVELLLLNVDE